MLQQIKNIKSGTKELRTFGITMAVILGTIGGFLLWRSSDYYPHLMVIAGLFLVSGLLVPVILKPVHKVWMTLSIILGTVMTAVILVLLFYLVFTPAGLLARLSGKRFLEWKFDPKAETYWIPKQRSVTDKGHYERQF